MVAVHNEKTIVLLNFKFLNSKLYSLRLNIKSMDVSSAER